MKAEQARALAARIPQELPVIEARILAAPNENSKMWGLEIYHTIRKRSIRIADEASWTSIRQMWEAIDA